MRQHSIIFDLDGTLVDSSFGILESLANAFDSLGIRPTQPLTQALIGPPLHKILVLLCPKPDQSVLDHLTGTFKAHYDTTGYKQTQPFPGISDMLKDLVNAKVSLYIATNKRQKPTLQILESLRWSAMFDQVFSLDSFNPPLSNKARLLSRLLNEANLNAKDCIYVGDRLDDHKAAQENDIAFALAEWGFEGDDSVFSHDILRLHSPNPQLLLNHTVFESTPTNESNPYR